MSYENQCQMVLAHMRKHGCIDLQAARKYGIERLAARICDLRDELGRDKIRTERFKTKSGKRPARYWLQ